MSGRVKDRVFGVVFLAVVFIMLLLIIGGVVIKIYLRTSDGYYARVPKWTGEEDYPLQADRLEEISFADRVLAPFEWVKKEVEEHTSKNFLFRMPFVLGKKYTDELIGFDMSTSVNAGENDTARFSDIITQGEDGMLCWAADDTDLTEGIDRIVTFADRMKAEGRDFLFTLNPEKYAGGGSNILYEDYSGKLKEEIRESLAENGVDALFYADHWVDGDDLSALFFKTDHHWLPTTALRADELLCETLNEKYGYQFDASVFSPENYEIEWLDGIMLGSMGIKATEAYVEREDFPIVHPKYDTDLTAFNSLTAQERRGDIEELFFDYRVLNDTWPSSSNKYGFYSYGDLPLWRIHNNEVHDGSHILMIKASFADAMIPYLPAVVEDLDVVDPRSFKGSIESFIQDTDPDTVVIVMGLAMFSESQLGENCALDILK